MERGGIIQKANKPTDWVSPLVLVRKKDGKLRVRIDPRRINDCLKREHCPMAKREDIEAELAGARHFSRLDVNSGLHQIPLDLGHFDHLHVRHAFRALPVIEASLRDSIGT